MITSVLRSIIIYVILVVLLRLMGKRQLSEMQPYELVITLVIAELACIPMSDTGIPLYYGVVPIIVLFLLHYLLSFLSRKSAAFRRLLDGKSIMVITPDGVNYDALRSLNMSLDDLLEATLSAGFYDLSSIYIAFFQTNGQFCAIPTAFESPPTCGDLQVAEKTQSTYALPLILDGKVYNLERLNLERGKIDEILREFEIKSVKEVVILTVDDSGKVYLKPRAGKYITKSFPELAGAKMD